MLAPRGESAARAKHFVAVALPILPAHRAISIYETGATALLENLRDSASRASRSSRRVPRTIPMGFSRDGETKVHPRTSPHCHREKSIGKRISHRRDGDDARDGGLRRFSESGGYVFLRRWNFATSPSDLLACPGSACFRNRNLRHHGHHFRRVGSSTWGEEARVWITPCARGVGRRGCRPFVVMEVTG